MAHSYTNLVFHIIFGTKERRPLIDVDFQLRLYEYIGGTIRGLKATSLAIGESKINQINSIVFSQLSHWGLIFLKPD